MNVNPRIYPVNLGGRPGSADAFVTRSGSDYKVHSPAIVNGGKGVFVFANLTHDVAMVALPEVVVGPGFGPIDLPPLQVAEITLVSGAGGMYTYSVVMKPDRGGLVTAHGNSDPVIIIDPPCP